MPDPSHPLHTNPPMTVQGEPLTTDAPICPGCGQPLSRGPEDGPSTIWTCKNNHRVSEAALIALRGGR